MTVKEAWELYNEIDKKLEEIKNLMKRLAIRYQESRSPLGCFEVYPDEMNEIRKLIAEYCEIIEERKNKLI